MFGMIPFTHDDNLFRYLDNMERNLFTGFGDVSQFRCDIQDQGDKFLLEAELPGFKKDDIKIDLKGDNLTISATHSEQREEKSQKGGYIRRERKFGSFSRSFDVSGVDVSKIGAEYTNGILAVELPKKQPERPASTSISIR